MELYVLERPDSRLGNPFRRQNHGQKADRRLHLRGVGGRFCQPLDTVVYSIKTKNTLAEFSVRVFFMKSR